jgi:hypothetical protein
MTRTLSKPFVFGKYQACYLADVYDNDVLSDLQVLTKLDSIYTDQRQDAEILVSLHLLNVWIETGFLTGNSYEVREQTKQYLTDLYQAIGQEIGYIIFRP